MYELVLCKLFLNDYRRFRFDLYIKDSLAQATASSCRGAIKFQDCLSLSKVCFVLQQRSNDDGISVEIGYVYCVGIVINFSMWLGFLAFSWQLFS